MAQKKSVSEKTAAKAPAAAKTKAKAAVVKSTAVKVQKKVAAKSAPKKAISKTAISKKAASVNKPASTAKKVTAKTAAKAKATTAVKARAATVAKPKAAAAAKPASKKVVAKSASVKPTAKSAAASRTKAVSTTARRIRAVAEAAKAAQKGASTAKTTVKAVAAAVAKPVAKQSTPVAAVAPQPPPAPVVKKPAGQRHGFKPNEFIVYPAHGAGQIVALEEQEIAGISLELFVISFEKDKMTLKVPTGKHESVGMRKLAEQPVVDKAMSTLRGRARVKRTMWSRRAQEYEAKINSGDLISIAEVVRDLYRSESQPEQSYSERQLYEQALDRMAREIAAVDKLDERGAVQRITDVLSKSAKGRRAAEEAAEAVAAEAAGADVEAA